MNKIAIITDLHWGCRNDLSIFYEYFNSFYTSFIDYLLVDNINQVFILGDVLDRRKFVNFKTLSAAKKYMFDRFRDNNITVHLILGNHDIHYRESLELSSPLLVLNEYDNVIVYDKPKVVTIDTTTISMIPWICKENEKEIVEFLSTQRTDLCFGHFEFANFPMYKGIDAPHGMETTLFEKFELVLSGHYHTRSRKDNIVYIGTPYEMNWQDYGDPKGFHTFDLNSRKLDFHQNPNKLFTKIIYDETNLIDLDPLDLRNCFVRVIVTNKNDYYVFDNFINKLYTKGCYEIKIIEDIMDMTEGDIGEEINLEDTLDVLDNYIDSVGLQSNDSQNLKKFMKTLYLEAINMDTSC